MWKWEIKKNKNILPQQLITRKNLCGLSKLKHIMKFCIEMEGKRLKLT